MAYLHHNLPLQPTSFIGRNNEVTAIVKLLADSHCRLLTLVGPGGIGKTRLGIEVAAQFVKREKDDSPISLFPDGVYLVALQSVASANNIVPTIAGAIGFEFYETRHQTDQLIKYIGKKQLLLLLDNVEHLENAGEPISELLAGMPQLKMLVTSRESLNLQEEWLFHVEGMPVPDSESEAVDDYGAVRLFVERARRVRHHFLLNNERACVVQLCQLVDGLPLAIELAAAWLKSLSCHEIVTEIQKNLDVLETDMRGIPERHRSMRAVFEYSWQLLDHQESALFMALSMFRGGFRREAAEQIAGASLKTLSALVDKSMVAVQENGRYQLHELQRQYGAEHLEKEPDMETAVHDRHCDYYMAFMDRPFGDFYGYGGKETLQEIDADIDNVQAAWNWAVENGRFQAMHRCVVGLYHYSFLRSWHAGVKNAFHDGLNALRRAEPNRERDVTLGLLLTFQGSVDLWMSRPQDAIKLAEESIAILKPHDARYELAGAFVTRAWGVGFDHSRNPEEAKALMLEAAVLLEETGQHELQGFMYSNVGRLCFNLGQHQESERWEQKSLALSRKINDPRLEASTLGHLARLALMLGRYGRAHQFLLEGLEIANALENHSLIISTLNKLGLVAIATGDFETAEHCFQECLARAKEWGKPYEIADNLINLAHLTAVRQEFVLAMALYQESTQYTQGSRSLQAERLWGLGQIAFGQGTHEEAQRLHEESLQICRENNYRLQKVKNEDALGRIAFAQGLMAKAQNHIKTALQESIAIGAPPVILASVTSGGELLAYEGDETGAAELAQIILNHPASQAASKTRATQLLKNDAAIDKRISQDSLESAATQLLNRFTSAKEGISAAKMAASQSLLDPLSERELELLRLVAAGKSNREIAAELVLALGTVKSHLHNIYQKLNASSRTQAIVRAKELDLL
ncbi:MAG: tetratricopeptide repeat protein [Chloroflexi bacterium]|nr:tetratricopeptide repeat protein [Chloroflexota bacterium]